ncbi:ankyrin repeat and IBR domain-containing protein 1-like isoform X8 [Bolinopsis microptera]|uniref:ankyrin repeat and IBR domain-containing protein 1-like isoform X8 n=1 Tax=Bolinopsis microptera TaxID=2820187 RepID=UPI003079B116
MNGPIYLFETHIVTIFCCCFISRKRLYLSLNYFQIFRFMGTSGSKFRRALLSADEETALKYYTDKVLRKHVNVNDWLFYGRNSPIHLAAGFAMSTLLKRFIENGGNPNTKNSRQENIFHACVKPVVGLSKRQKLKVIKIEEDEDQAREACLNVIFDMAARGEHLAGMLPLQINELDQHLNTPLHYAAGHGYLRCVKVLVEHGAKLFIENKDSKTACDLSEDGQFTEIASYLEGKMVFSKDEEHANAVNDDFDFAKAELYSGMRCQDVQMQKDQLIVETADMLKIPLFTAEALLKVHDWNRKKLLDEWMHDKAKTCDRAGVAVPHDDSTSVDSVTVAVQSSSSRRPESVQENEECEICFSDFTPDRRLIISCRHVICVQCWSDYLTMKITENPSNSLECPGHDCSILVPTELVEAIVSKDVAQRYLEFGIQAFVDTHPDMKWCPFPGCGRAVKLPDDNNMIFNYNGFIMKTKRTKPAPRAVDCGSGHFFCWNCLDEAHEPCDCDLWETWQREIGHMKPEPKGFLSDMELAEHRANTVANSLWLITYSKPCPKCKSPIEKTEGCNHMKCWKCKYEFCWVCMEAWKIHSSETGGYFRCNRYQAVDKFNNSLAEVKRGIIEEHRKASKFQRFMHYYTRYHNHEMSHRLEEPLLSTAKMKMIAMAAVAEGDPGALDTSFIEDSVKELLKARRVLRASYPYGYYLQDGMHRKMLFEAMQNELEEVTEQLSQMVARVYLRTPKAKIIETALLLQQNRLKFVDAVANGLIPSPSIVRDKMKTKKPPARKKPRDPFFDDDSDQDTEDALIRLAIAESLLENANKITDQEAVAFSPYARCVRYGCPLPRAKDAEGTNGLYCSEYCQQMDSSSNSNKDNTNQPARHEAAPATERESMALALQLNHEENALLTKPDTKSLDSQTTQSLTDSQVFDSISAGKNSLISDKTSKCNLFLGDSPIPTRGRSDSPRGVIAPRVAHKKDSISSLRADNISNLSYSVWERGSIGTNELELASLSDVSSLCNLICMETGRSGVMSRSHSPAGVRSNSPAPARSRSPVSRSREPSNRSEREKKQEKKNSCPVSLRVFALLLDNVNVQRKYLTMRSSSLPNLDSR